MKSFKFTIVALFVCAFVGCNYRSGAKQEMVTYSKDNLSIRLPKYWKVKKDGAITGAKGSRIISINNTEPFNKGGYLVITQLDTINDMRKMMESVVRNSRASFAERHVDFGISKESGKIKIGDIDAYRVYFETRLIANKSIGNFTVFHLKGKAYSVSFINDVKDSKNNSGLVDSVIASLKVP